MARILLLSPPIYKGEYSARGSECTLSILPPLGLASIAGWMRKHGHVCKIIDGFAEPMNLSEIAQRSHAFDVVGITTISTYALRVNQLLEEMKKEKVAAPIVLGGPHATILPESCLEHGADYVVMGEGEAPMLELVQALEKGGEVRQVGNIAYKRGEEIIKNARKPPISPLDEIPMPAYDLLPMKRYRSSGARTRRQPSYSIVTSRGCTGRCSFCSRSVSGGKVRQLSAERITEEFFLLRDQYGAEDISIWDDNFLSDHDLAREVCETLIRKKFNKTWSVESMVDCVDESILKDLKRAGCDFIAYGIESGSQRVLNQMRKGITLEQIEKAVRVTQKVGIHIRGYFMMGLPFETLEEMEETIRFAIKLDIDVPSFSMFVPLPGTLEYGRAQETGKFPDPEYYLHGIYPEFNFPDCPLYIPEGMTAEEFFNKHKSAYNRYYFRPKLLLKTLRGIRSHRDIKRLARGGTNLIKNALCNSKNKVIFLNPSTNSGEIPGLRRKARASRRGEIL
jgi:anaerobic magnesium-protoporphyrin IX monomethyl ester cyclase